MMANPAIRRPHKNMVEKPETQVFYGTPPLHKYVGYAKNKTGRKMGNYS
jgi:hypothetical protein